MVANLLHLCGVSLGPDEKLVGATDSNLTGHFEHTGFHEINEALLKHFGGSWHNPPYLKPGWQRDPALVPIAYKAQALVDSFADYACWGWKEPRTTVLLPFWQRFIPNLRFIICLRNPLDVARSVAKRDGLSIATGVYLWNLYTRRAIRDTHGYPRIFIFYEDYFRQPSVELNRVIEFCGLKHSHNNSGVQEAISQRLRHETSKAKELLDDESTPTPYKLLYFGLRGLVLDDDLRCPEGEARQRTLPSVSRLLELMDDVNDQTVIARLQAALIETEQRWSELKTDWLRELETKDAKILKLQQDNARLQTFSDAVRQTIAYRFYRTFIRVFR